MLEQTRIKLVSIERGPLYFYSGSAEVLFKNRLLKLRVQGQLLLKKKRKENEEKQKDKQISATRSKQKEIKFKTVLKGHDIINFTL